MTRNEFERALRTLMQSHRGAAHNERCIECNDCERCFDCTFCQRSSNLLRCHYCVEVKGGVDCIHCRNSHDLMACTHCSFSARCLHSAYLSFCHDCSDCHYCFGCVGLSGRDFHILNEPYSRSEYFEITSKLKRELGDRPLRFA